MLSLLQLIHCCYCHYKDCNVFVIQNTWTCCDAPQSGPCTYDFTFVKYDEGLLTGQHCPITEVNPNSWASSSMTYTMSFMPSERIVFQFSLHWGSICCCFKCLAVKTNPTLVSTNVTNTAVKSLIDFIICDYLLPPEHFLLKYFPPVAGQLINKHVYCIPPVHHYYHLDYRPYNQSTTESPRVVSLRTLQEVIWKEQRTCSFTN